MTSLRDSRLYYDDSYTRRFESEVVATGRRDGRPALVLERTYFYPESGGQLGDHGSIAGVPVVDVQADDERRVWHVLEGEAPAGQVEAEIDWKRRFDFMQQHTGQHILSAALERVLDAATLSCRLGEDRNTVEVDLERADWRAVERVERAANAIVWDDRPIERHWVDREGLERFTLRKPPKVTDQIRIVEIPDWDVSACGGTHVRRTGEVGAIKIVGWEKVRGHVRFVFHCGERALRDQAWRVEALVEAGKQRSVGDRDVLETLERVAEERDALRKQVDALQLELITREAADRVRDSGEGVAEFSDERARADVRTFAIKCLEAGAPWVVAGSGAPDATLVVGRAKDGALDLRTLVPELKARAAGKGGGSPELVQIAAGDGASARAAFDWAVAAVRERHGGD